MITSIYIQIADIENLYQNSLVVVDPLYYHLFHSCGVARAADMQNVTTIATSDCVKFSGLG